MTGDIKINVTGGNASFGGVSQGDGNSIEGVSNQNVSELERQFEKANDEIATMADKLKISIEESAKASAALEKLKIAAVSDQDKKSDAKDILTYIGKQCDWAYPIFKDCVKFAWPLAVGFIVG